MLDISSSTKFFMFEVYIFNECTVVVLTPTLPEPLRQTCHSLSLCMKVALLTVSTVLASLNESMLTDCFATSVS